MKQLFALVGLLAACGGPPADDLPLATDTTSTGGGGPTAPVGDRPTWAVPAPACSGDSPRLGAPGQVDVHTQPLQWRYDDSERVSWADPVAVELAEGVTGLQVVVDAGAERTGFAWVVLGDEVWLDAGGSYAFKDRLTPPASLRADTYDTAADSAWDTALWSTTMSWWWSYPFFHAPAAAGTLSLPMHRGSRPHGGCLTLAPIAHGVDLSGTTGSARLIVGGESPEQPALDVRLVVVRGAGITQAELEQATDRMFEVWAGARAVRKGTVRVQHIRRPEGAMPTQAQLGTLRATALDGDLQGINLFFVADFLDDPGTLGVAAGIPGPVGIDGTHGSGVVLSVEGHMNGRGEVLTGMLGETMAHEVGHQLGLFHTTEAGGDSFDLFDDTPECRASERDTNDDGEVGGRECRRLDGRNFMFWTSANYAQDQITPQQAEVLREHVITR